MLIREAAEMYLETILVLEQKGKPIRAVDVAREMGYSRPTVSEQMKRFRENGYIVTNEDGTIELTDEGRKVAEITYERHNMLARIFMKLGVSRTTAYQDACRVEHYISQETFDCMKKHFNEHGEDAAL